MKCMPVILLIFVVIISCQSVKNKSEEDDDLGKIIYANILFRHGDRTPIDPYPNDPHRNESEWPVPFGQLTPIGMHQHLMLGRWLRSRYKNFLPEHYSLYDIYIRSTDADRALMSAESNLAGLYPPKGDQIWDKTKWMPIPVHTMPLDQDYLLAGKKLCPRYNYEYDKLMNSMPFQKIYRQNAQLFEYLSKHAGRNISTITGLEYLYNLFYIETLYNKTLPAWTKPVYPDKMQHLAVMSFTLPAYNKILQRLKIGSLIGQMVNNMIRKSRNLLSPDRKIWMYSGHDETIANLLMALGVFEPHCPPYAAAVLIELRKNLNNQYLVTVSYKNTTDNATILTLPGCQKACLLDDFIRLTEDVIPKDIEKECSMAFENDTIEISFTILIVSLIAAVTMTAAVMLISNFVYSYYKRKYIQYYFRLSTDPI